jgi:hypothetical protein
MFISSGSKSIPMWEQDFGLHWLLDKGNGGTATTLEGNLGFNIVNT